MTAEAVSVVEQKIVKNVQLQRLVLQRQVYHFEKLIKYSCLHNVCLFCVAGWVVSHLLQKF